MNMRVSALVVAVLVASLVVWGGIQQTAAQPKEAKTPAALKWEYKRVETPNDADLNKFGEEGWELVTVVGGYPYSSSGGSSPGGGSGFTKVIYVFKRPKQ